MKSCIENKPIFRSRSRMRYLMNTFCSIHAEGDEEAFLEEGIEEAFLEIKRTESLFSRYSSNSQLARINQGAANFPVKTEKEVFHLIKRSLEISQLTYGAFDVSLGTAIDLWRLSENKNTLPNHNQIQELRINIGYQNIILDSDQQSISFIKPGIKIDLGALVKGYALDRVVAILKQKGIKNIQINLGGNIYLLNTQPQTIAIRNPLLPQEIATTVTLNNTSISTSANDERFFVVGNRRLGHLLNPFTGYPAESDILSASVISQDATLADALSTAIFILNLKVSRELLSGIKGVEAVVITASSSAKKIKVHNLKGGG